jgi:adenylate cyclase
LEEARIAVSLDDKDAMAHAVLAHMRMWGGEWEAAIAEARTALVLNPNSAFVISMLGCVLGFGGYREEALARLQQAMRASPHDPLRLWTLWTAIMQFYSRKFDLALETLHQLVRLRPGFAQAQVLIAATLAHLGRLDEARDVFSRAQGQDPRYQKPPWIKPEDNTLRIEGIRLAAGEMK